MLHFVEGRFLEISFIAFSFWSLSPWLVMPFSLSRWLHMHRECFLCQLHSKDNFIMKYVVYFSYAVLHLTDEYYNMKRTVCLLLIHDAIWPQVIENDTMDPFSSSSDQSWPLIMRCSGCSSSALTWWKEHFNFILHSKLSKSFPIPCLLWS